MESRLLSVLYACVFALSTPHVNAALVATNIAGSDGSVSIVNATDAPLVISNIQGLALTNPTSLGDNYLSVETNSSEDMTIVP